MRHRADELIDIMRAGFEGLRPHLATQQADHDSLIKLQTTMDGVAVEIRELRRDNEARHGENVRAGKDLEGRVRGIEELALSIRDNANLLKTCQAEITSLKLSGAKLSGVQAVFVVGLPLLISVAGVAVAIFALSRSGH